jgi:AbrB family looped-hinge helix DNA binding protein
VLARLSSKGQLVIPHAIRERLKLEPGAEFEIKVVANRIVLEPVASGSVIDQLYGSLAGQDLLGDLEEEHRSELTDDPLLRL